MSRLLLSIAALFGFTVAANAQCATGYTQLSNTFACQQNTTGAPVITSPSTLSCTVGTGCSYQITATNSPTSWGASSLPVPIGVNTMTGLISGTPVSASVSTVGLSATNGTGTGTQNLTLTIHGLWTPANLTDASLELWWDANNAGSLSLSGSNVLSWTDLKNGVVLTPTGMDPTLATSLLHGLPGVVFTSPEGLVNTSTSHASFATAISVFTVFTMTTAATWGDAFNAYVGGGFGAPAFGFSNTASPEPINILRTGLGNKNSTTTLAVNTPSIIEWISPAISGGTFGPVAVYVSGNAGGTISALTGLSYTQTGVGIGADGGGGNTIGNFHEIVVLHTQASTTDRQLIEGYLAWKWGLQGSLPAGHPYKSAAPAV